MITAMKMIFLATNSKTINKITPS